MTTSIVCPQCGSAQGMEYRPNCFICPHCDSQYRWSDPHLLAVRVERPVCFCGTNSIGACTFCGTAICDGHHTSLQDTLQAWQFLRKIYSEFDSRIPKYAEQALPKKLRWKQAAPGWLFDKGGLGHISDVREFRVLVLGPFAAEFLTPLMEKMGWENQPLCSLLCLSCTEECFLKLGPLFDAQAGRFAQERRFCETCRQAREQDDPDNCYEAIPALAISACKSCGKRLCQDHQRTCGGCGAVLCKETHATFCPECSWRPWRWSW